MFQLTFRFGSNLNIEMLSETLRKARKVVVNFWFEDSRYGYVIMRKYKDLKMDK